MHDNDYGFGNIFRIIWKKKKFIILVVSFVTVSSIVVSLLLPKWYKATAIILPPSQAQPMLGSIALLGNLGMGDLLGGAGSQNRYLSILKSRTLLQEVANKFNLKEIYGCENIEETINELRKNYKISVGEEMQISVTLYDQYQDRVAEMTNYIIHCLDSLNIEITSSKAKNIREFVGLRMEEVIDSLRFLENETSTFMESKGILSLEDQVSIGVMSAAELKSKIIMKEIELAVAKKTYEKNNPQVFLLENELESFNDKYQEYFMNNLNDKLFPNFKDVPEIGIKLKILEREVKYYTDVLEFLGPQYEKAKIEETKDIPTLQVLDKAVRPEKKSRPRRAKIVIISFIFSLVVSSYFAYFTGRWESIKKNKRYDKNDH